jgi:hypothetical protein
VWTKTLSCVAFSLAFVPPALGLDFPDARSTLKGLTAVRVVIGNVTPEIEQDGLTQSGLQADVELRLRQSAIRLVGALLIEQNDEWLCCRRYLSAESMALILQAPDPEPDALGRAPGEEVGSLAAG